MELKELEEELLLLLAAYKTQKHEFRVLKEKNRDLKQKFNIQIEENIKLKETTELLKTANAISGNQEYKKLMKSKINNLIRQIDRSIDQIKI